MLFTSFIASVLLATASLTSAAPINAPQELIVFSPPITSPTAAEAWRAGTHQIVKWSKQPIPFFNANTGVLLLGHMKNGSENLDVEHPLASGFPINTGSVEFTLPKNIPERSDYFVVCKFHSSNLFGDSGNKSPKFKIHA
ncbi:hypothetical protein CVT24_011041 [Panaeolus cyanescens]|uniref:Yeast cell wall synthesis Kre9/Knh1-like N-terminal domain-containing protein n=1 Tax=Panaeolus cyanescens TaxID=181874 RepID=A0A409VFW7_9AGAR|nr:hypothetical protein CVT24_011041 [Panaeolus cyanescens]